MTIDRLREALSALGPPPDARELSEMLWLACHITPAEAEPAPAPPVPPPAAPALPEVPRPPAPRGPSPPPAREPLTGLHPRPASGAEPVGEAAEVLVPTAPMLADALGVQRALRPLKRRVPSRHRRELDEDATAARIADTRLWTPVLVPSPERWLTLSLVVDTGPTMRLWRPLARELAETLIRQGAFQDVHVSYLDRAGRITSTPGAPPQDPRTLVDASGRHAVLVLSDCSGPHWWKGHAPRAVRHWAQAGPTAILQPLAERLWRRTAAPTAPGLAVLPRPGAPNTDLRFTPFDGAAPTGVPVPVLEAAPRWFAAWARLVTGAGPQPAAVATLAARPSGPAPVHRERELPIAERVRRFLTTASPDAAELAAHVAVSVPSLPVMRLIQHRILGGSGPGQLAEVLLSGLLRPVGDVRYEFVPGAREALLDTLPRPEALHTRHVLEAVSAEIERRAGTAAETFRALLPRDGGPVRLTADTDHFALITPRTRTLLTPTPARDPAGALDLLELLDRPVDELLGDDWDRPPHPAVIGMDGRVPVILDVLNAHPDLPHGVIRAPRATRRWLVRSIVWSLALGHSPSVVNFAFVAFSTRGRSLGDLRDLPHVAADVHDGSADMPTSALPQILETEWRRRKAILRSAGTDTWEEYPAALADGRATEPLPALVVIMDNARPWLDAHPDLSDPLVRLYETGAALGVRFIICSPDDLPPPGPLMSLAGWNMGPTGHGGDLAFLHVLAQRAHPAFLPARVSPERGAPIVQRMRRRGPQAYRLTPPAGNGDYVRVDPITPDLDVLVLNTGWSGGLQRVWGQPASAPRNPTIGFNSDRIIFSLSPLELSSGLPHGLVVGAPEARQRIVRNITLALASGHSPAALNFVFAGLGEHPLGEPLPLPHVRYSEEELLGRPEGLQHFVDFLLRELNARASAPGSETHPRLLVVADVSLTFPSSRPEIGETLLSMAQRGRALGVQLLLTSTSTENTTIWDRFLPLLDWRIAAGPLPPAELRRILGRARLSFPNERTAYLRADGGSPYRFTVALQPPAAAVEEFVQETHEQWRRAASVRDATPGPADPERSRAVLIGMSDYSSLPDLPAVRNNLAGVKDLLSDPLVWGLPDRNCVVLAQSHDENLILHTIERAASEAEDVLLIYYAGHGLRSGADGGLFLPLPDSGPGGENRALSFNGLQRAIGNADGPRHKVMVLDCCSSGPGAREVQLPSPAPESGTFVMSSTSDSAAEHVAPDGVFTPFTGALIHVLREGIAGGAADLDMGAVREAVADRLSVMDLPSVSLYSQEEGAAISLFRNRAHAASAAPEPSRAEVGTAVWERLADEANSSRGDGLGNHHLAFFGRYGPEMEAVARMYGTLLADLGKLPHGDVTSMSWRTLVGQAPAGESAEAGVLLIPDADEMTTSSGGPMGIAALEEISRRMSGRQNHPVIIMCGEASRMRVLLALLPPAIADRIHVLAPPEWGAALPELPRRLPRSRLTTAWPERLAIGVEDGTGAPVALDFGELPHLMVIGERGSGRTGLLRLISDALSGRGEELYVADPSGELIGADFAHPGPPTVSSATHAAMPAQIRPMIVRLAGRLETAPGDDVYLIIDDHHLLDPMAFLPLEPHIGGGRLHLVVARTDPAPGNAGDPLLGRWGPHAWATLRMGGPTPGERVPGRGVLIRNHDSRLIQVATAF
ncbi:caspase, EACC1-associated type [Actinomadura chokoriensis]|uniref:caspase, EACC1-associated type n=1 Tax=Actinomadura chokoriensis TaxID=454156 RepID=UPI0031F774BA